MTLDLTPQIKLAKDSTALIDNINTLLTGGMMSERTRSIIKEAVHQLENAPGKVVVTCCNGDPQGDALRAKQEAWCARDARRRFVPHLGQRRFLGLLAAGACLVGNSSSGIWEAPSLGAPAINVGRGRKDDCAAPTSSMCRSRAPDRDSAVLKKRVQMAIYLTMISPDYAIQK